MAVTDEQFQALTDTVNSAVLALSNTVTFAEVDKIFSILEQTVDANSIQVGSVSTRVSEVSTQSNNIALRFKRYATNEALLNLQAEFLPTEDEKNSFPITASLGNPLVVDDDIRLSNERFPLQHSARHHLGGIDPILHDSLSGAGIKTHTILEEDITALTTLTGEHAIRLDTLDVGLSQEILDREALNADTLPLGVDYQIPTKVQLARVLAEALYDHLVSLNASDLNPLLTKDTADTMYEPVHTEAYATVQYLREITENLAPDRPHVVDMGSPSRPFKNVYALNFIEVPI